MKKQAEIFLESEGEAWLKRNLGKLPVQNDPILTTLADLPLRPKDVLEIGCANGWRLEELKKKYGCRITGVDPGVDPGSRHTRDLLVGTAEDLPFKASFDLVIYGFCLYLVDREDLFQVAAEGDKALRDGGYLLIYDFSPTHPHAVEYSHRNGLYSYKMDHAQLWLSNPAYSVYARRMFNEGKDLTSVTILKKNMGAAWPIKKL